MSFIFEALQSIEPSSKHLKGMKDWLNVARCCIERRRKIREINYLVNSPEHIKVLLFVSGIGNDCFSTTHHQISKYRLFKEFLLEDGMDNNSACIRAGAASQIVWQIRQHPENRTIIRFLDARDVCKVEIHV